MNIEKYLGLASRGGFTRYLLNRALYRLIPFNGPHRLKVLEASKGHACVLLPYRRNNLNHLKGLHACALATLAEYTSGIALLSVAGDGIRIIMKSLHVEYHKQGKTPATATYTVDALTIKKSLEEALSVSEPLWHKAVVEVVNASGEVLCTAAIEWQLKQQSQSIKS